MRTSRKSNEHKPEKLATGVASLVSNYRRLDGEINDTATVLIKNAHDLEKRFNDELIPQLVRMQTLLSQRGDLRKALRSGNVPVEASSTLLSELEELPSWTDWYEDFRKRVNDATSLRTVQRAIRKLKGAVPESEGQEATSKSGTTQAPEAGAKEGSVEGEAAEKSNSGSVAESENDVEQQSDSTTVKKSERIEVETGPDMLTRFAVELQKVLSGESIEDGTTRIRRAAEMARDLQRAIGEGRLFESARPVALPEPPPIAGEPVPEPDPDPGTFESLRQRVFHMADTAEIDREIRAHLQKLVKPLLEDHPYKLSLQIGVNVSREDGRRLAVGDWLECTEVGPRLQERIGGNISVGRITGVDEAGRPKVRWHDGQEWKKAYSFSESNGLVHVLFDWQVAERFPKEFSTYLDASRKGPGSVADPAKQAERSSDDRAAG